VTADLYLQLAKKLDELPGGFPRTASGVEMRILHRLFSLEEVRLALCLNLISEPARVVAYRAGVTAASAAQMLAEMESKGLIYGGSSPGKQPEYMLMQFVVGFWEAQVNRLDAELVKDFEEYLPLMGTPEGWGLAPQLRTVPVGRSIPVEHHILPYENAEAIVRSHQTFAVADCICRKEMRILGHDCGKPLQTCLAFDSAADHFVRAGRGIEISLEDALAILQRAEETGLVLQPGNDQHPSNICACCGCCCGVLRTLKRHPKPGSLVVSPFTARLDESSCTGCSICVERCQMEAIRMDSTAVLEEDRCIGCGLCVSTCPSDALRLERKSAQIQRKVPRNIVLSYIKNGQAQGKLSYPKLVGWKLRSWFHRLLTIGNKF
jgi:electron transport complex protein RnfB